MISFFANIFGYILNIIYELVKNYGLAIIVLSVLFIDNSGNLVYEDVISSGSVNEVNVYKNLIITKIVIIGD
mgnify:CR=1 FL=1